MAAGFILAINLAVSGLLASTFVAIAFYERGNLAARWFAVSFAFGMVNALAEFSIPFLAEPRYAVTATFASVLAALMVFNLGLASFYRRRAPVMLMTAAFALSVIVQMATYDMPRSSFLRMVFYQTPYFVMQAVGAWLVLTSARRDRVGTLLGVALSLSALHFLAKPFIAAAAGGNGATAGNYLSTNYALISQTSGTVLALTIALLVLVVLVRRLLADVSQRARTDSLSGLLNRGAFEAELAAMIAAARNSGMPVSLVLCDLDHFKRINDTYGHASGDGVIRTFARLLRENAATGFAVGRIGGEEFALALPGCNLATARLFAESIRLSFATMPVEGLPEKLRFTASFGVAELDPGEPVADALRRADRALYDAKEGGRDRIATAPPTALMQGFERRQGARG